MANKTISNTFVVNTVDDPVGLVAQYCATATPSSSSQIHTSFQTGDLYMRTRTTEETFSGYVDPNHPWNKIVGENGGETDYQFALSANLVTQDRTSATAPSDISSSAWQDAPMATTTQKPYLWAKVQKKDGNGNNIGSPSYIRLTGENAFVVDLENEMTSVALQEGDLINDVDLYFYPRAYYGSTPVINDCTITASTTDPDITVTPDNTNHRVRVQIEAGTGLPSATEISCTVTHSTYGSRTVTFIISGVNSGNNGDPAVLRELDPSLSVISFKRLANGNLDPPFRSLTLQFKKTVGDVCSSETISASGLTVKYSFSSMPASSSGGTAWGTSDSTTGTSWSSGTLTIQSGIDATNLYVAAFNSSGTLVDRETIPIVKDGDNGNDGNDSVQAYLSPDTLSIPCGNSGSHYVLSQVSQTVTASIQKGGVALTVDYLTWTTLPNGVSVANVSGHDDQKTITVSTSATAGGIAGGVNFVVHGLDSNNNSYSAPVTLALIPAVKGDTGTGERGKTGRFYYYAQEWSNSSTVSYLVSDAQAPYFLYNGGYWVFNPTANGTYTMAQMGAPSSSSANWQIMTNDFKYLITQAIFGDYAQFGSAIINGDFLMSTNGEISGEKYNKDDLFDGSPAYTMFNPLFPYAGSKASTIARKIVSTNTSYNVSWERLTDDFTLNQYNTYRIAVTARVSNSSCLGAIRIIFNDGGTDGVNDLYIMTVTGTSNATYYAIVTVPARYSDCHLVCGVSSASYTMYIEDISIECTAKLRDITQTIASTTAVNIADTLRLSRSKQCRIKVHVSSKTGGSIYVRLFYNNTSSVASSSLDQNSSSGTITLTYTRSSSSPYATFDLQAYMSSASYNATIDWITIEQYVNGSYRESPVLFTPNYVLDLLSGETYQSDGVFTGFVKKKEIVVNISNKSYYASYIYAGSYVIDYVDMLKTGTYVNVNFTQISRVALPIKRDLVGTTVIVKNTGTQDCYVAYVFKHTFYNTLGIVGANQIRYYELVSEKDGDGNEHIYWSASDAMTINTDYD